ncbi:hypothetical protein HDU98_004196 [Podochytrium sp. JEL0797]|nr:hypothetical protein HDU98_004196 [Podochytrium sp. JEL0797]
MTNPSPPGSTPESNKVRDCLTAGDLSAPSSMKAMILRFQPLDTCVGKKEQQQQPVQPFLKKEKADLKKLEKQLVCDDDEIIAFPREPPPLTTITTPPTHSFLRDQSTTTPIPQTFGAPTSAFTFYHPSNVSFNYPYSRNNTAPTSPIGVPWLASSRASSPATERCESPYVRGMEQTDEGMALLVMQEEPDRELHEGMLRCVKGAPLDGVEVCVCVCVWEGW